MRRPSHRLAGPVLRFGEGSACFLRRVQCPASRRGASRRRRSRSRRRLSRPTFCRSASRPARRIRAVAASALCASAPFAPSTDSGHFPDPWPPPRFTSRRSAPSSFALPSRAIPRSLPARTARRAPHDASPSLASRFALPPPVRRYAPSPAPQNGSCPPSGTPACAATFAAFRPGSSPFSRNTFRERSPMSIPLAVSTACI